MWLRTSHQSRGIWKPFSASVLLSVLFAITGCGFELRGQAEDSSRLAGKTVALVSEAPGSELANLLQSRLRLRDMTLTTPSDAQLIIYLAVEQFEQRDLSLTARARAAELELVLNVRFSLQADSEWLITDEQLTVIDQMLNDPLNIVGKREELRLIREEMRASLADRVLRRIDYRLSVPDANPS